MVEVLRKNGFKPIVAPPAADTLKYAFYILGASSIGALKLAARLIDKKKDTPQETTVLLTRLAVSRAAICEVPAIAGLALFILTGFYTDFYLLAVLALGLEIFNFPRLAQWEERLRGDFGQLPE